MTDPLVRFFRHVERSPECWLWVGAKNRKGYGTFWSGEAYMGAHRAAWLLLRGPIPEGLQIDHLCRVRSCVNPDHLEPVTALVNVQRSVPYWASRQGIERPRLQQTR